MDLSRNKSLKNLPFKMYLKKIVHLSVMPTSTIGQHRNRRKLLQSKTAMVRHLRSLQKATLKDPMTHP